MMSNPTQSQAVIITVEVDDVKATVDKVKAAGGTLDGDGEIHEITWSWYSCLHKRC